MSRAVNQIRQAIETFQEGGLTAEGWAEDDKDLSWRDLESDLLKGLLGAIIKVEAPDDDFARLRHWRSLTSTSDGEHNG